MVCPWARVHGHNCSSHPPPITFSSSTVLAHLKPMPLVGMIAVDRVSSLSAATVFSILLVRSSGKSPILSQFILSHILSRHLPKKLPRSEGFSNSWRNFPASQGVTALSLKIRTFLYTKKRACMFNAFVMLREMPAGQVDICTTC